MGGADPPGSGAGCPPGAADPIDVLVAGYASIDVAYRASAPPAPGRTTLLRGAVSPPPRFGGCGPNAARELARLGRRVGLVTWLGDDPDGRAYRRVLEEEGIDLAGSVVATGEASPRALLFYDPDGGAVCYYHPSGSANLRLTGAARGLLRRARAVALTVAPAALAEAVLDARRPDQPVAWNVKADPDAYPLPLRRRLLRAAAAVCLNRDEAGFVGEALAPLPPLPRGGEGENERELSRYALAALPSPPQGRGAGGEGSEAAAALQRASGGIVVLTAGADGCDVLWPGGSATVPAEPVQVADPTGAGDAFFAAFVAAWLAGRAPEAAAREATERVAAMLRERACREGER